MTNIVLLMADQFRADCLQNRRTPGPHTPFLDSLARQGTTFTHAMSACPTCVPARMSLLTGLTASHHRRVGYKDGVDFDQDVTMAGAFSAQGYQTQAIGKMHVSPARERAGFDNVVLHDGYLHFHRHGRPDPRFVDDYTAWLYGQPGQPAFPDEFDNGVHCNSVMCHPWDKPEYLHPTNWVTDQTIDWLYRRDPRRNFFLYVSYHRPHAPYNPPRWAFDMYRDLELPPVTMGNWEDMLADYADNDDPQALVATYPDSIRRDAMAGYFGNITHLDAQIERLVEALYDFGLADDTIIAFTSDHGDMMGDHGMWRKGYAYAGSSSIPLFITGPGIASNATCDTPVELMDVMPTLLDVAGLAVPQGIDGLSAAPLLRGEATVDAPIRAREYLHGEHTILGQSMQWITTRDYTYIWWSKTGAEQLFHTAVDPQETNDLLRQPQLAQQDERMLGRCRSWLIDCLTGREEGFVADGRLVAGRPVTAVLTHAVPPPAHEG